jgi:two-component system, NtrC family, sensor kinase
MLRFRTLTQRFGALYALVIAILISLSIVVTLQLRTIRLDSDWLVGESNELSEITSLIADLDALELLLPSLGPESPDLATRAQVLIQSAMDRLESLPSNDDAEERTLHDIAENAGAERILVALADAAYILKLNATRLGVRDAAAHVSDSHEEAFTLLTQARESVRKANQHVHTHVRISLDVLLITLGSTALLLALALRQAQVNIVHPLRALSKGADRLGRGELRHRIDLDRLDEIGSLATAFNSMADQLADAHTNLEKRVRKRTQDFIRAARLADLGVLASGIAHELNTPLASIASSAEGLQRRANSKQLTPELMADYTQVITTETARAREITTRMLGLVRQDPGEIARVPLALIAKQAVAALNHRAEGKQVSLASAHVDEGVHVLANAGELVQVIVNLLANAIDASPPTSIVEISTWVEGSRLFLEVSDRGDGIPEEKIDSIFDPFYTTKSPGEGTGLGLALVATMVEFRGGTISVHSHLGSGTVFQVDLPAVWSQPR